MLANSLDHSLSVFDQPTIELISEGLAVFGTEVGWAAPDVAAAAELVEHVTHSEPLSDVDIGLKVAPGIERRSYFGHHVGRERNICGRD